jgi:ABC-2 type transport system ATP-binding protein
MNEPIVVKTTALCYHYPKSSQTLSGIELLIERGSIYGFLGPNGSGKTTTLRLLLGLLKPQKGSIELFGMNKQTHSVTILKKIGALIESPSLYSHLTAQENLEVYRAIYGVSEERAGEVLSMVGLTGTGKKTVRTFSLGMKQKLAIALALLPRPELLILDEPSNGLDPAGILELRHLVKRLNKSYGMTIIISSHLLSEVEKVVSHVGIISSGKLVFQGTLQELHLLQQKQLMLQIKTSDNDAAYHLLERYTPQRTWHEVLVPYQSKEDIAEINRILVGHQLAIYQMQPKESNLEQLFLNLTTSSL